MKCLTLGFLQGLLLLTSTAALAQTDYAALRRKTQASKPGYEPAAGLVPTADAAKKIAEAVWIPIYGKEHIEKEKPFHAVLTNNEVWIVQGSLHKGYTVGGTAYIEINKRDSRILKVIHGK
jgi:hypothetical protein